MFPDTPARVFICYASEDRQEIARPIALALRRRGLKIWYDEFSLKIGDSLQETISKGLAECEFGIVILSHNFFQIRKVWTKKELGGLYAKEESTGRKAILPIWHNITKAELARYNPPLADIAALTSEMPTSEIVHHLVAEIHRYIGVDLQKFAPTGIFRLDRMLGGGIRRGSSFIIEGPKGVGKTTLGIQMQLAALDRGESCLFISYGEPPTEIIRHMIRLGAPLEEYVQSGLFRIFDNFSSPLGITEQEVNEVIPESFRPAIIRVEDPADLESYYRLQVSTLEAMGMGGINVIDSTNERYEMMKKVKITEEARKYFERFKVRLGKIGKQIGAHIATDLSEHQGLLSILGNIEDGIIHMRFVETTEGRIRYMKLENMYSYDEVEHEFIITEDGIDVL